MEKKNEYRWFIEPLEAMTNMIIYQALDELGYFAQPTKILDSAKQTHEVWEVTYVFIKYIQKSKNLHATTFNVYYQKDDTVCRWRLHEFIKKAKKKKERRKK